MDGGTAQPSRAMRRISTFPNAINAVRAAVALQRALSIRPDGVHVRIGMATGELVTVDDEVLRPDRESRGADTRPCQRR